VNLRRGLLRLWISLSALWVVGVGLFAAIQFSSVSIPEQIYIMKDATSGFFKLDNVFDQFDAGFKDAHWTVAFPNNVTLYVVNSISRSVVEEQGKDFYAMYSKPRDAELLWARLRFVGWMLLVASVPPIMVAVFAAVSRWIAAGFK
jgi:hypothetical protein